jgi:uncharacterized protein (DUF3820 family)
MDDNSIMTFGLHEGKKLANIPDHYFRWLYEKGYAHGPLKEYIEDNATSLKIEIKK